MLTLVLLVSVACSKETGEPEPAGSRSAPKDTGEPAASRSAPNETAKPKPAGSRSVPNETVEPAASRSTPKVEKMPVGKFHLVHGSDAINVELKPDGSFRWGVDGCDYQGDGVGKVVLTDGVLRFESEKKLMGVMLFDKTLSWIDGGSFQLTPLKRGHRVQTWKRGWVCPTCGGKRGPSEPPTPCEKTRNRVLSER